MLKSLKEKRPFELILTFMTERVAEIFAVRSSKEKGNKTENRLQQFCHPDISHPILLFHLDYCRPSVSAPIHQHSFGTHML